jgi:hypothetical protein
MGASERAVVDAAIHLRGSHLTLGEVVPRRVPLVLTGDEPVVFSAGQSGRKELARWLVAADHPLTSRVMVNRIWRWHFGQGLVATPDNFGALGSRPVNQPLLDWLAHRFIVGGWSIKAMHRLIMLSSTYQQSSRDAGPRGAEIDPENRLFHRMNVRRLEAESIRDALLALGGTLDPTMGGSLLTVKNRGYFFDHTSRDTTEYGTSRRSVYLPIVRNHLYDEFELFDSTDATVASGDRATTTVAPQALFMMNSNLVLEAARDLATALLDRAGLDTTARIRLLYEKAYSRPPSDAESARATAALERFEGVLRGEAQRTDADADARALEQGAWQALCQVILASSEFIHIR